MANNAAQTPTQDMVRLSSLEELGLGLSGDALEPFLDGARHGRERWHAEMALRRRRILARLAKHLAGGWLAGAKRSTQKVRDEYDEAWAIGHERYDLGNREPKVTPWLWRGRPILFDAAGAARFRLPLYAAVIKQLKPRHILEVGSGDGINLLLLAGAFPEISFTGLELTAGGIVAARKAQDSPLLAQSLQEVGFKTVVSLLGTYAGQGADLSPWLSQAEINRDRNLRLQYLAGMGLNHDKAGYIYDEMLNYRRFPHDLFVGSDQRKQMLRLVIDRPKSNDRRPQWRARRARDMVPRRPRDGFLA